MHFSNAISGLNLHKYNVITSLSLIFATDVYKKYFNLPPLTTPPTQTKNTTKTTT